MTTTTEPASLDEAIEHSWIIIGWHQGRIWCGYQYYSDSGTPSQVQFNHQWVLQREEVHQDVIAFGHTHPGAPATPSSRDVRTMNAWSEAFGKPLLCVIRGVDGTRGYVFYGDGTRYQRLELVTVHNNRMVGVEYAQARATVPRRRRRRRAPGAVDHDLRGRSDRL